MPDVTSPLLVAIGQALLDGLDFNIHSWVRLRQQLCGFAGPRLLIAQHIGLVVHMETLVLMAEIPLRSITMVAEPPSTRRSTAIQSFLITWVNSNIRLLAQGPRQLRPSFQRA